MRLKRLELNGFKSFARKSDFVFDRPIVAIVGPNGSGKSNVVEAVRFVLGEQSIKSMRGKTGADLIFKGSQHIPQMSRASVTIVFDNRDRVFSLFSSDTKIPLSFDELRIRREVYRDGGNNYFINDQEVRMRDIHELISSIHIGSSGHHIISQGEADRYLNANAKERKKLIEEALGLRQYQYRLRDSQRKLEKARENLRELSLLRREIQPQLRFLKRQVEKIEKAKELREKLSLIFSKFFLLEKEDIRVQKREFNERITLLEREVEELNREKEKIRFVRDGFQSQHNEEVEKLKKFIRDWQKKVEESERELGRIEGMISYIERSNENEKEKKNISISLRDLEEFFSKILSRIHRDRDKRGGEIFSLLKREFQEFLKNYDFSQKEKKLRSGELEELMRKKKIFEEAKREAQNYIEEYTQTIAQLQGEDESAQKSFMEAKDRFYQLELKERELNSIRNTLSSKIELIQKREEELVRMDRELTQLTNRSFQEREAISSEDLIRFRRERGEMIREIERMKFRLEDMSFGENVESILSEFQELQERDRFLSSESEDIEKTIVSLKKITRNLEEKIDGMFSEGLQKINREFHSLFRLMFGGGEASLKLVQIAKRKRGEEDEMEELEQGVEIHLRIPRKRVSDLDMLSGGERSLTSIALLFALSQVNPPPFLILDETDAALDEENSRRYGDMLEKLSERSQLILVTHNRETMSRAQNIFGVTLGRDASSKLLSIRLEDATKYAK